jgi:uncharacterized protein (TIGR03437 family)
VLRQALLIGGALASGLFVGPATVGRLPAQNLASQLRFPRIEGFNDVPTSITNAADGSGRLFVTTQQGWVWIIKDGESLPTPFLDIRTRASHGDERGLLSIAFDPAYEDNGYFYAYYTDLDGHSVVSRFEVSEDPDIAAPSSETLVIGIEQPFPRHNGGQLQFGPDGYLYIGTGDGGGTGDPGNRAQNLSLLLGKILRIDVHGGAPYGIPAGNPFRFQQGARDEIWAYGLRNPWRFSFDRETGDLFIGDVGQDSVEEINVQPAHSGGAENYGWRLMEGGQCYNPPAACQDSALVSPALAYGHDTNGRSVTGGYVYRGDDFPQLDGLYFYADWVTKQLFFARKSGATWTNQGAVDSGHKISAFGEDERGELYIADWSGEAIYRIEADHPRPTLQSIVPNEVMAGGASFTMTLTGTNFTSYSEVLWNNKPRPTMLVSKTTLQAEIPATDIAKKGMAAVTVRNPQPGGRTSASMTFMIEAPPVIVPEIFEGGVGGAAGITALSGVVAGSIASVYGLNLATESVGAAVVPLPTSLGGGMLHMTPQSLALRFNGEVAVPQFYSAPGQQNVQIPWEMEGFNSATMTATLGVEQSVPINVEIVPYNPGLFSTNAQGFGQGSIQIVGADGLLAGPISPFTVARPAKKCEYITIWATGLGAVTHTPDTGAAALVDPLSYTTTVPEVTLGGVPAPVFFSGLAPGFVGLYQVNVKVPEEAPSGNAVDVILTLGGVASNAVTMAIE